MSTKKKSEDFETQWQRKLGLAVEDLAGIDVKERVLAGGDALRDPSTSREKLLWTCEALGVLAETAEKGILQEVLTRCHCWYPNEDLLDVKLTYRLYGDIDQVLAMLQSKFEAFLGEILELDEVQIQAILDRGWGLAGKREGNRIIATKLPKSGFLQKYLLEDDPVERRRLYCHCPRIRDEIGSNPALPLEYCYCGAGFYQGIWEEILGESVEVEVLETVMTGGDVCRIAIHLP